MSLFEISLSVNRCKLTRLAVNENTLGIHRLNTKVLLWNLGMHG